MKPIMIGCGALILLVVALLVTGFFVATKGKDARDRQKVIAVDLEELRLAYPYRISDGFLELGRLDATLTVRKRIADEVREFVDGEGGGFLGGAIEVIPKAGEALVAGLRDVEMSPDEYAWYAGRLYTAIRDAESGQDAELGPLWEAYDKLKENPRANPSYLVEILHRGDRSPLNAEQRQALLDRLASLEDVLPSLLADDFVFKNQFSEEAEKDVNPRKAQDLLDEAAEKQKSENARKPPEKNDPE